MPFLVLLLAPVAVFLLLTWQVMADGPLLGPDEGLSRALIRPDRFSELLSDLGNVQVAVPVLVLAAGWAARRARAAGRARWWFPAVGAGVLMALVPLLVVPVKVLTDRPGTPAVPPATGYFPSGHTATALIAYGAAALLLLPWLRRTAARRALVLLCAAAVLGVSYGLVRRGYHWPLDVVASWCLGAALLLGYARALRAWTGGPPTAPASAPDPASAPVTGSSCRMSAGTPSSRSGPS